MRRRKGWPQRHRGESRTQYRDRMQHLADKTRELSRNERFSKKQRTYLKKRAEFFDRIVLQLLDPRFD